MPVPGSQTAPVVKIERYIERTIKEDGKPRVVKIINPDDAMLAVWARKGGGVFYTEKHNGRAVRQINMRANEARELLRKGTKA